MRLLSIKSLKISDALSLTKGSIDSQTGKFFKQLQLTLVWLSI